MDPVSTFDDENLENYRIVYDGLLHPPTTSAELYRFVRALTGHSLPFESVCKDQGHVAPWTYLWRSYRADLPAWEESSKTNIVYVGARAGYKTISVASLIAAELLLKPKCETVGMGAVQNHADRTYQLVRAFLRHPVVSELEMVERFLMKETVLRNGSKYGQVCGTMAGANALHPQKLRTEENDLMKERVLEESRMMRSSWGGLNMQVSYVSSRKFEGGNMDNMVQNAVAKSRDFDVLISCYKDSAEPCPVSRRGEKEQLFEVEDIYNPGKSVVANAYEGCKHCPLLPSCKGDLARAKGIVPIDDLIADWNTLERDTWIWQKECGRTRPTNLYFSYYDEAAQVGVFRASAQRVGWIDFSFDFSGGGDDPTVCGFWQTDENDNDFMVGELVFPGGTLAKDVAEVIWTWWNENGRLPTRHQLGDSAAQQWIQELNAQAPRGNGGWFRIQPVTKIQRRDGWKLMRQRIRDNNGDRRLFIDGRCKLIIHELKNCRRSKVDPEDIANKQSDHSLDQARYRLVQLRYTGLATANVRLITQLPEARQVLPFCDDPDSKMVAPSQEFGPWYMRGMEDPEGD